jgi:hypothetical protein
MPPGGIVQGVHIDRFFILSVGFYCGIQCSEKQSVLYIFCRVLLFVLCTLQGRSRVYLRDVSMIQLR